MAPTSATIADWTARFLEARGPTRVFGLQGGHIQPIWDRLSTLGIPIVDVRHEGAAVHMATAHALLTGELGVALATSGPGVTNTVTSVANADLERAPILVIGGCPPARQDHMGPLQGTPHVDIMRPITRLARTLRTADQVLRELDHAVAMARGHGGLPGPVYIEVPADVLRARIADAAALPEYLADRPASRALPDPRDVERAAALLAGATHPLVISGAGARGARDALLALLDASGAAYLDTQESRGLVPARHPAYAGAMRAMAMADADLVLTVGRKLDYQLGYGSPAAFPNARFIRIAAHAGERDDNRAGTPALPATLLRRWRCLPTRCRQASLRAIPAGAMRCMPGTSSARASTSRRWRRQHRVRMAACIRIASSRRCARSFATMQSASPTAATS